MPPFATTANIGRARSAGVEFVSEVVILDNLVASLNYTYTDSENLDTDQPLPREPRHRWNGLLTWEPIQQLSLFTEVHVSIRQFETLGDRLQLRPHAGQRGRDLAPPGALAASSRRST